MAHTLDLDFADKVKKYGAFDVSACFNCGNCTAICPLSNEDNSFPRPIIRKVQLGMTDKIESDISPWLCYYCGECSATCPREAEPAEAMMSVRRYLTAKYDWTGLGEKLYLSAFVEMGSMLAVGLFITVLFLLFHGQIVRDHVALNTFAPVKVIELGDLIMAAILGILLLSNAWRMVNLVLDGKTLKIPLKIYYKNVKIFILNLFTQKQSRECETKTQWWKHLIIFSGYSTMFILIVFFLRWFQTDNIYPIYNPQRWLGYLATIALLVFTGDIIIGRLRKDSPVHKFSHASDWIFPIMLFLSALTGILVHIFRYQGLPMTTYVTYVIHLSIVVPMLVIEVPFGKWSHLFYRPLALYLDGVKKDFAKEGQGN